LQWIVVNAERRISGRDIANAAGVARADAGGQQDRALVDHRIDHRLQLDEQHRITARANLQLSAANSLR
jgi:hypothetical protein